MRRILKSWLLKVLQKRGLVLTAAAELGQAALADHLRRVFATYGVDRVLDVGANLGQFRDLLRAKVGFQGPILSFEPVSAYAQVLDDRARFDPDWRVYPFALGSRSGEATINLMSSPGLPSLLRPDLEAMHALLPRPDATVIGTERITIRRLDDVLSKTDDGIGKSRTFLKLDTQGYDLEVLKGATLSLRAIAALQTELSVLPIYQGMPDYRTVLDFVVAQGFDISGIFPVTEDHALRAIEFDCIMVNPSSLTVPSSNAATI